MPLSPQRSLKPLFRYRLPLVLGSVFFASSPMVVQSHEGHDHSHSLVKVTTQSKSDSEMAKSSVFQVGEKTYRWEHREAMGKQPEAMIAAAKGRLHNNADQDLITKEIVTVVNGYGLVSLDAEMSQWKLLEDQDPLFAGGMNAHGTDCFVSGGESFWAFASTNTRQVVISNRGQIVGKLGTPTGTEFDNDSINKYYADGGSFVPCDVVYAPKAESLIVVTGYAPGDYALTAKMIDGAWTWSGAAWGGKENRGGMFSTAHGVEVTTINDEEVIEVASRAHGRVFGFDASGQLLALPGAKKGDYIQLPAKSNPCNLSHVGDEMFLPLLNPLADSNGVAPVLVISDGEPVGRLVPAEYEGLEFMHHMHGFCPVQRDGKLFGIVLSWPNGGENKRGKRNDGQIAIFEAVEVK